MKKTAIAFAVAAFATAATQAAPQANTFYVGARAGWASAHYDLTEHENHGGKVHRNSATYGVFAGYQINDYLATELAYDYFGNIRINEDQNNYPFKMTNHGASFSVKAGYPILNSLDVYGRVGAALVRSDYRDEENAVTDKSHSLKVSPVFAAGVEYAPMPELGIRLEYSWLNKVGKLKDVDGSREHFAPRFGSVTLGVDYRFGQAAPVTPVKVSQTFSEKGDVLFAFGKANLRKAAESELSNIYAQVSNVNVEKLTVAGYTDRIGPAAYNQKLSQQRAEAVAKFFESKGIPASAITAVGYGSADPVVQCDNVHGNALIKCLAPNRRVDITVEGTK